MLVKTNSRPRRERDYFNAPRERRFCSMLGSPDEASRHEHPLADVLLRQVVVVLQPGVLERQQKRQPRVLKVHFLHGFDLEPLLLRKAPSRTHESETNALDTSESGAHATSAKIFDRDRNPPPPLGSTSISETKQKSRPARAPRVGPPERKSFPTSLL